jgi:hypothetical protein
MLHIESANMVVRTEKRVASPEEKVYPEQWNNELFNIRPADK